MHIKKYDKLYTRRQCLESWGKAAIGAGILMPLFDAWAGSGDVRAAYPDEALQIETYSKGAVKPGGMLDAGNVEAVKDLLDPVTYIQIKQYGRVCRVKETTTDINRLNPIPYLEAAEATSSRPTANPGSAATRFRTRTMRRRSSPPMRSIGAARIRLRRRIAWRSSITTETQRTPTISIGSRFMRRGESSSSPSPTCRGKTAR